MPGRIRAADLPVELRRKLVGRGERRVAPRRPRPTSDEGDAAPWWSCATCGAVFTAWAPAQRHAGTPRHFTIRTHLEPQQ